MEIGIVFVEKCQAAVDKNLIIDWCLIRVLKAELEKTTKLILPYAMTYIKKIMASRTYFYWTR